MNDEAAKCMHLVMIIITQTSHTNLNNLLIINGNAIFIPLSNLSITYVSEIFFVVSSSLIFSFIQSRHWQLHKHAKKYEN